jgi:glycosyltransferase involved in cell wall biosynthesis
VLSLAEALSEWADVTVAFRRVLEPVAAAPYRIVELQSTAVPRMDRVDDAAVSDIALADFPAYLDALGRFVKGHASDYDVMLEKSWLLSGYLVARCRRVGVPGVVVENVVRTWAEGPVTPRRFGLYARHRVAQAVTGHYLRRAAVIIAETEELREALTTRWRIDRQRIEVVGLGVDRRLFRPSDQADARRVLGLKADAMILLYAGTVDAIHDLTPLLDAFVRVAAPSLELHVVGDGRRRAHCADRARSSGSRVRFHGRVPHGDMPRYIAAADVCLAPYDVARFPDGHVAYSTLKIPEYLACARPVISVPSGQVRRLVTHGVTGFLLPNEIGAWVELLASLPSRHRLTEMGQAAMHSVATTMTWEQTAAEYLRICKRVVGGNATRSALERESDALCRSTARAHPSVAARNGGTGARREQRR